MIRDKGGRPAEPFVLVETHAGALRLAALDPRALGAKLRAGMTLAEARALHPKLDVGQADAAADARMLTRLAETCEVFTPLVGLEAPDGLMLDVTGCAHLFGGEAALRDAVRRRLARIGYASRVTIAGTPDAARALSRFSAHEIVEPGREAEAAAALPLAALEAAPETATTLARAGLRTLGDVAARSGKALAARFGEDLVRRLRRIMGEEDLRITPLRAPPDLMAEQHFADPLGALEPCLAVLEKLVRDIAGGLEARGLGGRAFEAAFFRSDGAVRRLGVETAQPTRDVASLMRLFRLRIDTLADPLDPGFGFDALRLSILASEALVEKQIRLDGVRDEDGDFADLVNRLVTRFGRDRVMKFVARDTHDPARAAGAVSVAARFVSADWPRPEDGAPPLRPVTLFDPPHPIDALAEVPDGPPRRFRWRRVLHEVCAAEGPERIAPEWWRGAGSTRDYYRVEDTHGRRFWLFRQGLYDDGFDPPRWYLHGLFA